MIELIEPIAPYTGSKYKLLPQLLPLFPPAKRFVDLFAGGGSVYSNVVDKYDLILVNDIIMDLMLVQQSLLIQTDATVAELMRHWIDRNDATGYKLLRDDYNVNPTPTKLLMLMLCCTNNMLRFNKQFKFNQTHGKRTISPIVLRRINVWAEKLRPHIEKIDFSGRPFHEVETREGDFLFVDPPYTLAEAGYNAYWDKSSDDGRLFQYLIEADQIGAKFCVCGFDQHDGKESPFLKSLEERGFVKTELASDYEHVSRKNGAKNTKEVVFTNYNPAELA